MLLILVDNTHATMIFLMERLSRENKDRRLQNW